MKEKRYFCDWVKEHEDNFFEKFWGYFGIIFLICFLPFGFITMLGAVPPHNLLGVMRYIGKWLVIIILCTFITALILAFLIFVIYLLSKKSQKRKEIDKVVAEK